MGRLFSAVAQIILPPLIVPLYSANLRSYDFSVRSTRWSVPCTLPAQIPSRLAVPSPRYADGICLREKGWQPWRSGELMHTV